MMRPSLPSKKSSHTKSLSKQSAAPLPLQNSIQIKSRITVLSTNFSPKHELLKEHEQFENREVQTDRPRFNLAEAHALNNQQSHECSLLMPKPKEFLIRKSVNNLLDRGSLTARSQKNSVRPFSKARNTQFIPKNESDNFQHQIDCEKRQSDRNLAKFRVHLQTVSCFSDRFKEKYFGIVRNLDKIRLKNMELQMNAQKNNLTNGMKNQYLELFDSEMRVKNLDDMAKLRTRALKVHDLVNNQTLWTHK